MKMQEGDCEFSDWKFSIFSFGRQKKVWEHADSAVRIFESSWRNRFIPLKTSNQSLNTLVFVQFSNATGEKNVSEIQKLAIKKKVLEN